MEEVLMYLLPAVFISHWIVTGLRKGSVPGFGYRMARLLPVLCFTAAVLFDGGAGVGGISAGLLAADLLSLDALELYLWSFSPSGRRPVPAAVVFQSAVLVRCILTAAGVLRVSWAADITVALSGAFLAYTVCADVLRLSSSGRQLSTFHERVMVWTRRMTMAQLLTLCGLAILAIRPLGLSVSRPILNILTVVLSVVHIHLLSPTFFKRILLGLDASGSALIPILSSSGKVQEESLRMEQLFRKVEDYMRMEKPFLDEDFTLIGLANRMAANKSLVSRAINLKSGKNFCQYANKYRIDYAVSMMKRDSRLRVWEISIMSGFHSVASFNMAFKLFMNDTPSEYMRTLHSSGLKEPRQEEGWISRSPQWQATKGGGEP